MIAVKGFTHAEDLKTEIAPKGMSKAEAELRSSMRTLWESRAILLRAYIISEMNDSADVNEAKKQWYENARSLAGFFAITHNQTKKDLTDMLCKHLDLTWGEIDAILKKNPGKDLDYYEKDRAHMVMFSDVLVDGLIKQFPYRFKD